jgi:hypothetical protein
MKKLFFFWVIFLTGYSITYSQIVTFDSARVLMSSNVYDYRNPKVFSDGTFLAGANFFVYEKWNGNTCNIAVRRFYYDSLGTEVMITNDAGKQNINPHFDYSLTHGILVWQSNVSGNWDVHYSFYSGGIWTARAVLAGTSADETTPVIYNNFTYPVQYNFSFLTFKRGNDIILKVRKTQTDEWFADTNVTFSIANECFSPVFSQGSMGGTYRLNYLKKISGTVNRICYNVFSVNNTSGMVTLSSEAEMYQPNSQNNLHYMPCTREPGFEYDTLGGTHTMNFNKYILSYQQSGININFETGQSGPVTNSPNWYYGLFAMNNKRNDSSSIKLVKNPSSYPSSGYWKSFYLGDDSVTTRIGVSPLIEKISLDLYKIYVVWEKMLNGKSAFYYAYMTESIGNAGNVPTVPEDFRIENYPNPFNSRTNVLYELNRREYVTVSVFDVTGREVARLAEGMRAPGVYRVNFESAGLSTGVYYCRMKTGNFSKVVKMAVLK